MKRAIVAGYVVLVLSPVISRIWQSLPGIKAERVTVSEVVSASFREQPAWIGKIVKFVFEDVLKRN